eukprot:SAG11_NODE_26299_length_347_cov_0.616935_1_plen_43_part_01
MKYQVESSTRYSRLYLLNLVHVINLVLFIPLGFGPSTSTTTCS